MIRIFLSRYAGSGEAATAIEYGLLLAGISLAIVTVVFAFGEDLAQMLEALQAAIASGMAS